MYGGRVPQAARRDGALRFTGGAWEDLPAARRARFRDA
jgi:hypothetical protein